MEDINDQCPHFVTDSIADDINSSDIVQGETYIVYSSNGTILDGKVVQCREVSYPDANSHHPHLRTEYYVHYIDQNQRLDEWISPNQILGHRPSLGQYTSTPDHTSSTNSANTNNRQIKQIDKLRFRNFEIETWYYSPYPEEFADLSTIYVCQYCLRYMQKALYANHRRVCVTRQPPGQVIYRKGTVSVYEIDGHIDQLYCQLLSLLGKLFIEGKTLCYDVELFSFYVLCEINRNGAEFIGYFSKEKRSKDVNNLACLAVLPPFHGCGYGRFLIEFSYELSKRERKITGPERPLSDFALIAYNNYWTRVLVSLLTEMSVDESTVTVKNLSRLSCIAEADIVNTLEKMKMIKVLNGVTIICATRKMIRKYVRKMNQRKGKDLKLVFDPMYLKWNVPSQ